MNLKSSLVFPAVVFALCLALIADCSSAQNQQGGSSSSSSGTPNPSASPIPITASELYSAYEENEVAADEKYKGKVLSVTGTVKSIDSMFGLSITLGGFMEGVECNLGDSQKGAAARLKKGEQVTVQGTCVGSHVNVGLKNCVIKASGR